MMGFPLLAVANYVGAPVQGIFMFWLLAIIVAWLICYGFTILICLPVIEFLNRRHKLHLWAFLVGAGILIAIPGVFFATAVQPTSSVSFIKRFSGFVFFWESAALLLWFLASIGQWISDSK
jgi:ABC-type multidrug transport system permease subunit